MSLLGLFSSSLKLSSLYTKFLITGWRICTSWSLYSQHSRKAAISPWIIFSSSCYGVLLIRFFVSSNTFCFSCHPHFLGHVHFWGGLYFWGYIYILGHLTFSGHLFWGHLYFALIFNFWVHLHFWVPDTTMSPYFTDCWQLSYFFSVSYFAFNYLTQD